MINVCKNRIRKTCGRQSLKNFTWSIIEYLVSNQVIRRYFEKSVHVFPDSVKVLHKYLGVFNFCHYYINNFVIKITGY